MLRHFADPGRAVQYLAAHSDEWVLTVRLPLRPADMPRRPDGSIDVAAIPERVFGTERVRRHPDGSAEYLGIGESELRALDQRGLHRSGCATLASHGDQCQIICRSRAELDGIMEDHDSSCLGSAAS